MQCVRQVMLHYKLEYDREEARMFLDQVFESAQQMAEETRRVLIDMRSGLGYSEIAEVFSLFLGDGFDERGSNVGSLGKASASNFC